MPDSMEELVATARRVRANAYAPYSVYQVGAAVLGSDGNVYTGVNVENASFGLTICAERSAVANMVTAGCREIKSVAVATKDGGTPCGMCLQTLLQFSPRPAEVDVACVNEAGETKRYTLADLLPFGFQLESNKQ